MWSEDTQGVDICPRGSQFLMSLWPRVGPLVGRTDRGAQVFLPHILCSGPELGGLPFLPGHPPGRLVQVGRLGAGPEVALAPGGRAHLSEGHSCLAAPEPASRLSVPSCSAPHRGSFSVSEPEGSAGLSPLRKTCVLSIETAQGSLMHREPTLGQNK